MRGKNSHFERLIRPVNSGPKSCRQDGKVIERALQAILGMLNRPTIIGRNKAKSTKGGIPIHDYP